LNDKNKNQARAIACSPEDLLPEYLEIFRDSTNNWHKASKVGKTPGTGAWRESAMGALDMVERLEERIRHLKGSNIENIGDTKRLVGWVELAGSPN